MDLSMLLSDVRAKVKAELESKPQVVEVDDLTVDKLYIEARKWHALKRATCVAFDLQNSSRFGYRRHAASVASILEGSMASVTKIAVDFSADFLDIQGDGGFALFWGQRHRERAICAGITIKTFSEKILVPQVTEKWPDTIPDTGFKVGLAGGRLLVKKVGMPRTDYQEPIWVGRPVNYAVKCAQCATVGEMVVTKSIWEWIHGNDYLRLSCDCGTPSDGIWADRTVEKIREDDAERDGGVLHASWCDLHGPGYCANVLAGKRSRPDHVMSLMAASLVTKERRDSQRRRMLSQLNGARR